MKDIYCEQIIPGKLPVDIIFETDKVMAFHHTKPYWERHVVIIPKAHIESLFHCCFSYTRRFLNPIGYLSLSRDLFGQLG